MPVVRHSERGRRGDAKEGREEEEEEEAKRRRERDTDTDTHTGSRYSLLAAVTGHASPGWVNL